MEENDLKLSRRYLEELTDFESKKLVGKILKRYEIVRDRDTLKSELKELIYEEFRQIRDLILAYNKGYEISIFKFNKKGTEDSNHGS